ncbi:LysE family transporter [Candidatus Gracilibacteria bacterium]|nr:LysE family transporter [Candidatus Gracilibacteria bacterium]NUJ98513.1 LysE family transporter [Candidatus Gracilibacteria bacterium]
MNYTNLIFTIISIHLLATISPGPDFIMTIKNSLNYGRKIGIFTAIGIGLGIGVHILYCALGLALVISKSIILFNTIKILGALYLIYIGILSFKSKGIDINITQEKATISKFQAFKMGFLTNVLNPKATLFFLSLFTFILSPSTPIHILLLIALILIADTILWFIFVSLLFTQSRIQIFFSKIQKTFNKIFGGILIAIGVKIIFNKN